MKIVFEPHVFKEIRVMLIFLRIFCQVYGRFNLILLFLLLLLLINQSVILFIFQTQGTIAKESILNFPVVALPTPRQCMPRSLWPDLQWTNRPTSSSCCLFHLRHVRAMHLPKLLRALRLNMMMALWLVQEHKVLSQDAI